MKYVQALAEARKATSATGTRHTVRGLRFRDGWQYFVYETDSATDRGIRNGDRRFWEHVREGSPGVIM